MSVVKLPRSYCIRPEGPAENRPGRKPGVYDGVMSSPEGATQNPWAAWVWCRPFRAHHLLTLNPGLTPGAIDWRPFGAQRRPAAEFRDRHWLDSVAKLHAIDLDLDFDLDVDLVLDLDDKNSFRSKQMQDQHFPPGHPA